MISTLWFPPTVGGRGRKGRSEGRRGAGKGEGGTLSTSNAWYCLAIICFSSIVYMRYQATCLGSAPSGPPAPSGPLAPSGSRAPSVACTPGSSSATSRSVKWLSGAEPTDNADGSAHNADGSSHNAEAPVLGVAGTGGLVGDPVLWRLEPAVGSERGVGSAVVLGRGLAAEDPEMGSDWVSGSVIGLAWGCGTGGVCVWMCFVRTSPVQVSASIILAGPACVPCVRASAAGRAFKAGSRPGTGSRP